MKLDTKKSISRSNKFRQIKNWVYRGALPKSTCAKGGSRSFHSDQETTADTLTGWYCQNLFFAREDIEKYKIQIPTSITLLQKAPF